METDNPFAAPSQPVTPVETSGTSQAAPESLGLIAKRTFIVWEKLRFAYIAILAIVTVVALMYCGPIHQHNIDFWAAIVFGAVVANLCYFLGPIVETYLTWLGFPSKAVRLAIFSAGTIFAGILAFFSVILW